MYQEIGRCGTGNESEESIVRVGKNQVKVSTLTLNPGKSCNVALYPIGQTKFPYVLAFFVSVTKTKKKNEKEEEKSAE